MPQITDTELLSKAVEEISEKYHVPATRVLEAIQQHHEVRKDLNPREVIEWAIYKADKDYHHQAESQQETQKQSQGYKIG